jgi:hypothetical protein
VQLSRAGNDITLIFQRPHPAVVRDGNLASLALGEITAIVHMSASTMKDLSIVLDDAVGQYEATFGKIETDFTRRRQEEHAAAGAKKH